MAVSFAVMALGAWPVMHLLKVIFKRDRPPFPYRLVDLTSYSFPSGHAMMSMVVFGGAAFITHAQMVRRWRAVVVSALFLCTITIGATRVVLGAHWFSDVIAGWTFGLIWIVVFTKAQMVARGAFGYLRR